MGRFYSREMGLLLGVGTILGWGVARVAGLGTAGTIALAVGGGLTLTLMVGPWLQDLLVGYYAQNGMLPRALDLAVKIRNSAPTRSLRSRASVDLALVQIQAGDAANALRNLEDARIADFTSPGARSVVQGHLAYCLAQTDGDLVKAEELGREAMSTVPDEGLFAYYVGLVLFKAGKLQDAEQLMADSIVRNADLEAPVPGERPYFLALCRKKLGREFEKERAQALSAGGRYGDLAKQL